MNEQPKVDYAEFVKGISKNGEIILKELSPQDAELIHMVMGISGEAGELLDAVKKPTMYRKPWDRENVVEELGDMEFYMERFRQIIGITRQETIQHNFDKLSKRYSKGYTDKAAIDRADKS